jgi:hypothetical protein
MSPISIGALVLTGFLLTALGVVLVDELQLAKTKAAAANTPTAAKKLLGLADPVLFVARELLQNTGLLEPLLLSRRQAACFLLANNKNRILEIIICSPSPGN